MTHSVAVRWYCRFATSRPPSALFTLGMLHWTPHIALHNDMLHKIISP